MGYFDDLQFVSAATGSTPPQREAASFLLGFIKSGSLYIWGPSFGEQTLTAGMAYWVRPGCDCASRPSHDLVGIWICATGARMERAVAQGLVPKHQSSVSVLNVLEFEMTLGWLERLIRSSNQALQGERVLTVWKRPLPGQRSETKSQR